MSDFDDFADLEDALAISPAPSPYQVGDAEQLPYSDATFDVVISMVGAMFAPDANRVASELLRENARV